MKRLYLFISRGPLVILTKEAWMTSRTGFLPHYENKIGYGVSQTGSLPVSGCIAYGINGPLPSKLYLRRNYIVHVTDQFYTAEPGAGKGKAGR